MTTIVPNPHNCCCGENITGVLAVVTGYVDRGPCSHECVFPFEGNTLSEHLTASNLNRGYVLTEDVVCEIGECFLLYTNKTYSQLLALGDSGGPSGIKIYEGVTCPGTRTEYWATRFTVFCYGFGNCDENSYRPLAQSAAFTVEKWSGPDGGNLILTTTYLPDFCGLASPTLNSTVNFGFPSDTPCTEQICDGELESFGPCIGDSILPSNGACEPPENDFSQDDRRVTLFPLGY